ncbi:Type I Iterative Polyketide synthase (PKS) [Pseudogymnoascus sp. 23342-1-I1]|nr:Type I Iterative Polyketide synthase (PKS) [Pseudogymnoascus sp. 23342-1-I1]
MSSPKHANYRDGYSGPQIGSIGDAVMPIAIIGVGGRFPGDAENPQKLWDMIAEGRNALSDVPKDRFNVDAFYHPHNERQGSLNVRGAHFMNSDISAFDAPFFSMTQAEAKAMDPQQRMALECTYEALENAGIRMEDVAGSKTSCYVGCFTRDYSDMLACDREDLPLYSGTGTGSAIMSNRISWFFDMKGPSISLDTACSSSMVALHLACQSIRTGESEMSVVGGTNLILLPDIMGAMTRLHFLSPDGKCQSFDHKANGYSRGEGAAFVVLKPLHLALENHDVIRGIIRNTAVNQDGNTPGITLPSTDAQEALIRKVYSDAGLSLTETSYVEAHGTGTPAGDPVEARALAVTFGKSRAPGDSLYIGSIKANIGHLEGGSGLAQITKAIMMLEKGEIPPAVWYEKPNPRIPMEEWNLTVPTKLTPWPTDGLRRMSINSFGYGGTNAHCIIDDAYHYLKARGLKGNHNVILPDGDASPSSSVDSAVDLGSAELISLGNGLEYAANSYAKYVEGYGMSTYLTPRLLVWSSHEQAGVERTSAMYHQYLNDRLLEDVYKQDTATFFAKFARTLGTRRSILPWKAFTVASTSAEAADNLKAVTVKPLRSSKLPKVAFIFTGQGAQWYAMGRELIAHRVFKESLEESSAFFVRIGASWSLLGELWTSEKSSNLDASYLSQPICTALQVALVDLLRHWKITPDAVVGHSSGEIAAAYAKGAISRQSALSISYHRGRLSHSIRGFVPNLSGAMLATGLGPEAVQVYIDRLTKGKVVIACINSPSSTTLSGDAVAIDEVLAMLKADEHFARRLKVDTAYHSPDMEVIAQSYLRSMEDVYTLPENGPDIKMFSSVTGKLIDNSELGRSYWVTNMLNQVNFLGAIQSLVSYTATKTKRKTSKPYVDIMVEIGPHSALQGPLKQILRDSPALENLAYVSVLQRGKDACVSALDAAGCLYQRGFPVNIGAVNNDHHESGKDNFLVDLPAFAWNRDAKYWFESHTARAHRLREHPRKDLFGSLTLEDVPGEPRYRNILKLIETPWVESHKVQGSILYPAAGMMIMAIEAACQKANPTQEVEGYELRDVLIGKAIVVPQDEAGIETMLTFKPWRMGSQAMGSNWQEFNLFSRQEVWELNCTGLISIRYVNAPSDLFENENLAKNKSYRQTYRDITDECVKVQSPWIFYEHLTSIGLYYGDIFQNLVDIKKGHFKSKCVLKVPDTKSTMPCNFEYPHVIHPATLDSIIQMALPACSGIAEDLTVPMVPTKIGRLYVSAKFPNTPGTLLHGYGATINVEGGDGEATVVVSDAEWEKPLVIFEGVKSTSLSGPSEGAAASLVNLRKLASFLEWKEDVSMLDAATIRDMCAKQVGDIGQVDPNIHIELELASFIYMKRVLKAFTSEEAKAFPNHLRLLYEFMEHTYKQAQEGKVVHQTEEIDWLNTSPEFEAEVLGRVSKGSTDGAIMYEHGENLISILRGDIPPLQVLMKDNRLHDFYQSGLGCPQHYTQMAFSMNLLAHKNPNMKILEIGGGTGGATLPILEALGGQAGSAPRFANYTFTDISVGFFEKAKEKLKSWTPFMSFAKLNIEEDPSQQGFEEGIYDVIVASNVLHATRTINETLTNLKKLLKPTGKLVLSEIINPLGKLRYTMIVGSLEGWWLGEDDGRHHGPTMTNEEWNTALLKAGFSGLDVAFHDFKDVQNQMLSVMVSTATAVEADPAVQDAIIVIPSAPGEELKNFSEMVAKKLEASGSKVIISSLQNATDVALNDKSCLVLLEVEQGVSFLPEISELDWLAVKRIILESRDTTWVSRGGTVNSENPSSNLMTGMARSIRSENPQLSLATVDLDYTKPLDTEGTVAAIVKIFTTIANSANAAKPDWEFAIRDDRPMVQRILLENKMNEMIASHHITPKAEEAPFKQEGRPLTLKIGTPGRLDTLRFDDDEDASAALFPDEVEIEVKGAGLNFKDIMVAMGQLSEPALGVDCSGIITRIGANVTKFKPGDKVITWRLGTFRNFTRSKESMCQIMPNDLTFGVAASLPVVYSTAYYALYEAGRLQKGETILIHGAAGGVGQAAIVLAQHIGAEVFVTVSSQVKKDLLMTNYNIPEDHILNSRDNSFVDGIMRLTNQRGVDVVLNSLAGEALLESWKCIAWFGRFLEMGQKDIVGNTGLEMAPFLRNVTFHSINMLGILDHNIAMASRIFREVVTLLKQGVAKPVAPVTVLPFSRAEEAFRLMQTGKHLGKVVLESISGDIVPVIPQRVAPIRFDPAYTYVLAGGSGGLGRCLAQWMVDNGAKNIVLLSRSGSSRPLIRELLDRLTKQGAKATAYPCDVGNEEDVINTLARCSKEFPPIRGVIQGAMVLRDAIFQNMTRDQFREATTCKVQGSWNLHQHLPEDLDFFVLLSSSVGIAGSRGQANYSAGNAYQDALAHYRRGKGLKACSIDVGMVLGVGFLVEETTEARVHENTKSWSFIGIREAEFLMLVQASITGRSIHGGTVPPQVITGLGTGGMMAQGSEKYPWWFNDAKFAHIVQVDTHQVTQELDEDTAQLQSTLAAATTFDEASDIVSNALVKKLAKSMMVAFEDIEASRPVSSYGVDSLLAVEVRAWLYSELEADISVFDLLNNIPISALARKIVAKSKRVPPGLLEAE